jgi:hypothetical protein
LSRARHNGHQLQCRNSELRSPSAEYRR